MTLLDRAKEVAVEQAQANRDGHAAYLAKESGRRAAELAVIGLTLNFIDKLDGEYAYEQSGGFVTVRTARYSIWRFAVEGEDGLVLAHMDYGRGGSFEWHVAMPCSQCSNHAYVRLPFFRTKPNTGESLDPETSGFVKALAGTVTKTGLLCFTCKGPLGAHCPSCRRRLYWED